MYVGCTEDLKKRIYFHKKRLINGFTKKYNVHKLVYLETYEQAELAYSREIQIKKFRRDKKNKLVERINPNWLDLSRDLWKKSDG